MGSSKITFTHPLEPGTTVVTITRPDFVTLTLPWGMPSQSLSVNGVQLPSGVTSVILPLKKDNQK